MGRRPKQRAEPEPQTPRAVELEAHFARLDATPGRSSDALRRVFAHPPALSSLPARRVEPTTIADADLLDDE